MDEIDESPLGDSFTHRRFIPVSFTPLSSPLGAGELLDLNAKNLNLLNIIGTLEGCRSDNEDDDEAIYQDVKRVELKVDLLLVMMNQLVKNMQAFPDEVSLNLSAMGASFDTDSLHLRQYKCGMLHLYLHPSMSDAISFQIDVSPAITDKVSVVFTGMNDLVTDIFEKYIFRQHRRIVAGARGL